MKRGIFIFLIIGMVFITSCGNENIDTYNPYYGSGGLYLEFLDNAPGETAYELQEIPVGFLLKNEGAYDITNGIITLSLEEDYLRMGLADDQNILLYGRSELNPRGEEQTKMFYIQTKMLDSLSQIHDTQIIANACYEYSTKLSANVCIDPDLFNLKEGPKPCQVEDMSFSGQGAPVGITYVEEIITRDKESPNLIIPEFEITIENLGNGDVIDYASVDKFCGAGALNKDDFGIVFVKARMGDDTLTCNPSPIKMNQEQRAVFRCQLDEGIEERISSYTTLLSIELTYGYAFSISKELTIQRNIR